MPNLHSYRQQSKIRHYSVTISRYGSQLDQRCCCLKTQSRLDFGAKVVLTCGNHGYSEEKTHSSRASSDIEPPCAKRVRNMVSTGFPRSKAESEPPCAIQRFLHIFILKSFALVRDETSASGAHSSASSSVSISSYNSLRWW